MINYLSISINPAPLDVKILVKKDNADCMHTDMAQVITMSSNEYSEEFANEWLLGNGLTVWAKV